MTINSDDEDLEKKISFPQSFGVEEFYDDIIDAETIKIEIIAKQLTYSSENLSGELIFRVYRKKKGEDDEYYRKVYSETLDSIKLISNRYRKGSLENLIDGYVDILSNKYSCDKDRDRDKFIPQKIFYDMGYRLAENLMFFYVRYLDKKFI